MDWQPEARQHNHHVETIELLGGSSLVLSRIETGTPLTFTFTEPEDTFCIGFHLRGGAHFQMENTNFSTQSNEAWVCAAPKGSVTDFTLPTEGFCTVSMRFTPHIGQEIFADNRELPSKITQLLEQASERTGGELMSPQLTPNELLKLDMMFKSEHSGSARRLHIESLALDLLAHQITRLTNNSKTPSFVQSRHRKYANAARDILDSSFQSTPTITELAKQIGTNEFTLKRSFKNVHGITIFAYALKRKMEHATDLLQQGSSVAETAATVGYTCARSFSSAYYRYIGTKPSHLRRPNY